MDKEETSEKFNTLKIQLGDYEREFYVCETTAPRAYDYGYTIEIIGSDGCRIVLVDASRFEYQLGRNRSGMFTLERTNDPSFFSTAQEVLYKRLYSDIAKDREVSRG